jgi:DNA adenine methylase
MIKSPLRYPGGKSKAIAQISQYIPSSFQEYREPFVGGGSIFIHLQQIQPHLRYWINDLNPELYWFWYHTQMDLSKLIDRINRIKQDTHDGRELFERLAKIDIHQLSTFDRAVRFFILNRITFSGTIEAGGYSEQSYRGRFTDSSIERLAKIGTLLTDIEITNLDYSYLLDRSGEDVFIFLDPPYHRATKSKLYGKNGILHTRFDRQRLADSLRVCHHRWLITYDDSAEIRELYGFANIYEWELQYGMNNYQQGKAAKGKELFICNYQPPITTPIC